MSGLRYHLTDDGPKFCTATVRDCPIGGAHFASQEDANAAFEFRAKVVHSSFSLFRKKPKVTAVDPHTKHLTAAAERISQLEPEFLERDARQLNNTLFHQLEKEGVGQELLNERFQEETKTRHATIGYGAVSDQDAPVVGIVYGGDYKPEEEEGLRIISDALNEGTYEPESVKVYEKDGVTLFAVRGKDSYIFNTGSDLDVLVKPEMAALERFRKQADDTQFERRWELEQKTFKELKIEAKDLGSKALSKKALIEEILTSERDPKERFPALGEFQNGRALVIASTDPVEIKLFHKLKEAHDGGHLRLGGSASPYGRGSLFYDDRDISRENKSNQIRTEEAHRYSNAYVSETRSKMERMNGHLYSFEPRVDPSTQDVRNVAYWIDWDVVGGKRVTGLFSKEQLERMTVGNFSDVN